MKARHMWLGMSLILALAWGRVEAQAPQPQVVYVQVPVQYVPVQNVPVQSVPAEATPLYALPVEAMPAAQPVRGIRLASWPLFDGSKRDKMNRLGHCCDSHIDGYGCQNWRTQCQFAFGSCRSFFGEPCRPAPPLFQHLRGGNGGDCNGGDCNR